MIVIAAKFKVRPEKKHDFMNLAQDVIESSRKEKGNISYNLYTSVEFPNDFLFFEEWASQEAIESHFKQAAFIGFGTKNKDMLEGDMEVTIYEAERRPLNG